MWTTAENLARKWPTLRAKTTASCLPLTSLECSNLAAGLREDGIRAAYSALVSLADSVNGLNAGFYSWTVVKLYYSVFYTLQSLLASDGVALFYVGSSPFWVDLQPGNRPASGSSSSHKTVMKIYRGRFPGAFLLSQQIALQEPLMWFQQQREFVNYKIGKFAEPSHYPVFNGILKQRMSRTALATYLTEDTYAFDPDHAIFAYPITALKILKSAFNLQTLFDEGQTSYLKSIFHDKTGPIPGFQRIFS